MRTLCYTFLFLNSCVDLLFVAHSYLVKYVSILFNGWLLGDRIDV